MSTPPRPRASIRDWLSSAPEGPPRLLQDTASSICLDRLRNGTTLGGRLEEVAGQSVLIATRDQFAAALALIELDGVASRLTICTPDLPSDLLPGIATTAGIDAIVSDHDGREDGLDVPIRLHCSRTVAPSQKMVATRCKTEWVLLTSGTTGAPKLIAHTFASLTAAIGGDLGRGAEVVWGTFYDIRRYGGLQILLRAILGRGSLVLAGAGEPTGDYLRRLQTHGVTHVSGTPSHWRRALMSPEARRIAPAYIRLSGEIADQGILTALRSVYPQAKIGHAYASTEAGVGFEVNDGLEGFPASLVGAPGDVQLKVHDGSLRIRSNRHAMRYLGEAPAAIADTDGFVDSGDMVERRGDRYHFLGRRSGTINVGGLKVYPEEVEAAINRHPAVRGAMVHSRKSSMIGSLVSADVLLKEESNPSRDDGRLVDITREILQMCHDSLAPYKVPVSIRFVPGLEVAAAGKLARHA
jgi:acyl-coenzyme A synthetase/AMP-(fatty) acid ligase